MRLSGRRLIEECVAINTRLHGNYDISRPFPESRHSFLKPARAHHEAGMAFTRKRMPGHEEMIYRSLLSSQCAIAALHVAGIPIVASATNTAAQALSAPRIILLPMDADLSAKLCLRAMPYIQLVPQSHGVT